MLSLNKLIQVLKLKYFNFISFKAISYNSSHLWQPISDDFCRLQVDNSNYCAVI